MKRILDYAKIEADKDRCYMGSSHILIGMLLEGDNFASFLLKNRGLTPDFIRKGEILLKMKPMKGPNETNTHGNGTASN